MEELPRILRRLGLVAWACLLLNLPSSAQTNASPNDRPRQPLLPTAFDTAAIQKAVYKAQTRGFIFSGSEPRDERPNVCATPLLESKADPNTDPGIRVIPPKQDQAGSERRRSLTRLPFLRQFRPARQPSADSLHRQVSRRGFPYEPLPPLLAPFRRPVASVQMGSGAAVSRFVHRSLRSRLRYASSASQDA